MGKTQMGDVIVIVPGITGSILQKNGQDLWALSGEELWGLLRTRGDLGREVMLKNDDPEREVLDDGIRATGLMQDFHWLPGLEKIDGYTGLRKMITNYFEVSRGNYCEFACDWRRDNRFTASRLRKLLETSVEEWRKSTRFQNARAIIIAHSMGGLVARYALEVLGGWRWCRALITFGTPFRGSPEALQSLAEGSRIPFLHLTEAVRSFTSVYQLLPIYEMVRTGGRYSRVAETEEIPGVKRRQAEEALYGFHRVIEAAVERNRKEWVREEDGYLTLPFAGTEQPTLQSAELEGGEVKMLRSLPPQVSLLLDKGDSTVPCVSAVPIEMSGRPDWRRVAERHSSLQNHGQVLHELRDILTHTQIKGWAAVRKLNEEEVQETDPPALSLDLGDLYSPKDPVRLAVTLVRPREKSGGLLARIQAMGDPARDEEVQLRPKGNEEWEGELGPLREGLYRVEVRTAEGGPLAPDPVHETIAITA